MSANPPILVAEADPSHVELVKRFLAEGGLVNPVHAVTDGEDAVAYLAGEGDYADRSEHPLPVAVITDLQLRRMGARELLATVRADPDLARIPVVVVTGSAEGRDIADVHRLGAAAYLVKPVAFEALVGVLHDLDLPWALQSPVNGGTAASGEQAP